MLLLLENLTCETRTRFVCFTATQDHPPKQAPVPYRLDLFPQGLLHQAHSCSFDVKSGFWKTTSVLILKLGQQWSMEIKYFFKRNQALGAGIKAWLALFASFADPDELSRAARTGQQRGLLEREKLVLPLHTARTWLEFFCCSFDYLLSEKGTSLKPLQKLHVNPKRIS